MPKTGTTSLSNALRILGYKVCGHRDYLLDHIKQGEWDCVWTVARKYSAFRDTPWAVIYQDLYRQYPEGKFILSVRNETKWINSMVRHFGKYPIRMNHWIFGAPYPKGNEKIYVQKFLDHNQEAVRYFKEKQKELLILGHSTVGFSAYGTVKT